MLTGSNNEDHKFSYTQSELADFGADVLSEYMENPGCCHLFIDEIYSFGLTILYKFSVLNEPARTDEMCCIPSSTGAKHKPE